MSERDAQISASPSSPRLDELSRAVTRTFRSAADAASATTPSFAESLASASQFVEGDDLGSDAGAGDGQGAGTGDSEVSGSGRKPGESAELRPASTARPSREPDASPLLPMTLDPAVAGAIAVQTTTT